MSELPFLLVSELYLSLELFHGSFVPICFPSSIPRPCFVLQSLPTHNDARKTFHSSLMRISMYIAGDENLSNENGLSSISSSSVEISPTIVFLVNHAMTVVFNILILFLISCTFSSFFSL
eukprot:TRINITY_DN69442_c0_g1_i1.p1 TRINITY_DN69442_c0_g1~~TRINITY_DN69442_c0_g1_i1.p1  ORF type:complete len:120 (+),score=11.70 TRINITY_DN69442_c0_g1_i1:964-1323(+)